MRSGRTNKWVLYRTCLQAYVRVFLQRLKAALHYTVGNVCSEVEECTFSRELVAIITETTYKQAELLVTDLELFAK